MTLKTNPIFYYGVEVLAECTWIDFQEGEFGTTLSVEVPVGSYTLEEYRQAVEDAFNSVGTLNYTVTIDRYTRKLTILTSSEFKLLLASGPHASQSLLVCAGFGSTPIWGAGALYGQTPLIFGASDTDLTFIHTASFPLGLSYEPQFCPQDYLDAENNAELRKAQVNESIDGSAIEVLSFGEDRFYNMNFRYITDLPMPKDGPIKNNQNALSEINSFLSWAIQKKVIEFMPNLENPNEFKKIRFEKGAGSRGTGYKLKELTPKLPEFYETGVLVFRRI